METVDIVQKTEGMINLDETPFVPDGLVLLPEYKQIQNRVRGLWKFDPREISFHLEEIQGNLAWASGRSVLKNLEANNIQIFPSNVSDYLVKKENEKDFPEEWKDGRRIHFWTLFSNKDREDHISIPCLRFSKRRGIVRYWADIRFGFDERCPAATRTTLDLSGIEKQYSGKTFPSVN